MLQLAGGKLILIVRMDNYIVLYIFTKASRYARLELLMGERSEYRGCGGVVVA